jgi:hypothetical protein
LTGRREVLLGGATLLVAGTAPAIAATDPLVAKCREYEELDAEISRINKRLKEITASDPRLGSKFIKWGPFGLYSFFTLESFDEHIEKERKCSQNSKFSEFGKYHEKRYAEKRAELAKMISDHDVASIETGQAELFKRQDALWGRMDALEKEIKSTVPMSTAGAIAQLKFVSKMIAIQSEFEDYRELALLANVATGLDHMVDTS